MALKERTVINRCEIFASGHIQVQMANEIYDTLTGEVKSQIFVPSVISKDQETPVEIQAFLDNSK